MIHHIDDQTLKNGEMLALDVVRTPAPALGEEITPFYSHKPGNYRAHIEAALADQCGALETRFYTGRIDDELAGAIMTVERNGVGILGHVYTLPRHRRKGICSAIMERLLSDFRGRDGVLMLLGTGYQSAAYEIYAGFGFRDWPGGHPGMMGCMPGGEDAVTRRLWGGAAGAVHAAGWEHWPLVAAVGALPGTSALRSVAFGLGRVGLLEGSYCYFMADSQQDRSRRGAVLVNGAGGVSAVATHVPDSRWPGVNLVDLFYHPSASGARLAGLIEALAPEPGRLQSYADVSDTPKIAALESCGFKREAVLARQLRADEDWVDVAMFGRE